MANGLLHLSIDWDFFIKCRSPSRSPRETDRYRFDVWTASVPSRVPLSPTRWWEAFTQKRHPLRDIEVVVADSHRFANQALALPGEGVTTLVHLDAHHDLGYDGYAKLDCGNWLRFLMQRRTSLRAHIVYPDWKGLADLVHRERWWATDPQLTKRMMFSCWNSDNEFNWHGDFISKIFICRSSAWTHPRHDRLFNRFVAAICATTKTPPRTPFVESDGVDPLRPRI